MKNNTSFLYKPVEDKTITWFENSNKYLVLENTTADILKRLSKGVSVEEIKAATEGTLIIEGDIPEMKL